MPEKSQAIIEVEQGDITHQAVDAIVNAANQSLLGGGGVDGAIHHAAGPKLLAECRTLGGCPTGEARITGGYKLPARFVIHTVGPVWRGGARDEVAELINCYSNSLQLAHDHQIKSIAFPCISTGAFGFPQRRAANIAVTATAAYLDANSESSINLVRFVCFEPDDFRLYVQLLGDRSAVKAAELKLF